jgi:NAD(P)H dehydrogenase (quinone)
VIAAILEGHVSHSGMVYPLHGPVEMNHYEIASEMGKALGREVTFLRIDRDLFRSA